MNLYKPSELFPYLTSLGIAPKKSLSQNFLIDGNIIRKILEAGAIQEGDQVLEIGPGPGCLTEALVGKGAKVVAVEKDRTLSKALERLPQVTVFEDDALTIPLEKIFSYFDPKKKIKLIANLPYHITTPLLARFISLEAKIEKVLVMVQDEVAKRITAEPGSKDYSSLTVFLQFFSDCRYCFKVSRNCFYPAPKVDSAIIECVLKEPPKDVEQEQFFPIVRQTFQQRRKSIRSSLTKLYPKGKIEEALNELSLPALVRPEEVSLETFIQLYHLLAKK